MRSMKIRHVALALPLICLMAGIVMGATTGKITGIITDQQTKEPLIGVSVSVVGTSMGAMTDDKGQYTILNVPVGTYTLKVSIVGYAELQINNVQVSADLATYENGALSSKAADLGKTIQVTAERPLVVKDKTATMNIIDQAQIRALPTRGVQQVVGIQSGVVKINRNPVISFRGARESINTSELDIRGGRPSEVDFYVDGYSQQDPLSGTSTANIANNAIKEVSVLEGGFPAEYGNVSSGIVNTITNSGTDKLQGNVELQSDNITKARYDNNTYSMDIGGPIPIKGIGKSYFFGSVERRWQGDRNPSSLTNTILPGDPRQLPHNQLDGWSYQGKLDFNLKPTLKLSLSGTGSQDKWSEYRHDYLFDIGHTPWYDDKNMGLNAKVTHTLNSKTFYNLSASYFKTERFRGDGQYQQDIWAYGRPDGNPTYPSGDPYFWYGDNPATPLVYFDSAKDTTYTNFRDLFVVDHVDTVHVTADSIRYDTVGQTHRFQSNVVDTVSADSTVTLNNEGSVWDDYLKRKSLYVGVKGDITNQVASNHTLKAGFEFQRHTLRYYRHLFPTLTWKGAAGGGFLDVDRYGYDQYGNESDNQGYQNATKHPINFAMFLQDRADWTGLIVNAGLRFDYFDYRTQRLRNPENPLDPDSIGVPGSSHFSTNPDSLTGLSTLDPSDLEPSKKFTKLSPRLGIAFPVSDRTQVHLNYGKFYQRPDLAQLYVGYNFFAYKVNKGGYFYPIGNPNLEPPKTTQYEVGMTHQLGDFTSLEVSAYYKDVLGLVQVVNQSAQPNSFSFYQNSDYSTIKGVEFTLSMRRNHNIELNFKYTLSYATGTGSYANTQQNIAWTASHPPKMTSPLDFDQRHNLVGIIDYRTGSKQGPKLGDIYPLENFGINILTQFASGTPYTPSNTFDEVTLAAITPDPKTTRNTAYGPWTLNIDMKAERSFQVGQYRITPYLWVRNLLNRKNVYNVYESTGRGNSTAWLETPSGQDFLNSSTVSHTGLSKEDEYILKENNPQNYGIPRMLLFGIRMSF